MLIAAILIATTALSPPHGFKISRIGQGIRVPDAEVLNVSQDLTIEAWIKPSGEFLGGPFHFIVSKNYATMGYALLLIGGDNNCRIQFEAREVVSTEMPMSVLKWHWWHVAGVYRDRKSLTLYVNGVKAAERPATLPLGLFSGPLTIGTSPWDTFLGRIGDVRIWSVARSQEQIVEFMDKKIEPSTPGLVADYDLSDVRHDRVQDRTGRSPDGTVLSGHH